MDSATLFELKADHAAELLAKFILTLEKAARENNPTPFIRFAYKIAETTNEAAFLSHLAANYKILFTLVNRAKDMIETLGEQGARVKLIKDCKDNFESSETTYKTLNN